MKIIDEKKIIGILEKTKNASRDNFEKIIEKAKKIKSLDLEEVGVLVNISDEKLIKKMQEAAHEIKMAIYVKSATKIF